MILSTATGLLITTTLPAGTPARAAPKSSPMPANSATTRSARRTIALNKCRQSGRSARRTRPRELPKRNTTLGEIKRLERKITAR